MDSECSECLPDQMLNHNEVIAVKKDSWDVTEDKHKDNADEDEGQVDLFPHSISSGS